MYPYAADRPVQTGLGGVTTAFTWAFLGSKRVQQYLSAGLQWKSYVQPPVGSAWAVIPSYAIAFGVAEPLLLNAQLYWIRSFASAGYPELDLLVFEPTVVLNLPGRTFLALDSRLGWNFVGGSFLPLLKGIAGLYLDLPVSLLLSRLLLGLTSASISICCYSLIAERYQGAERAKILGRRKSVSISAWYQTSLARGAEPSTDPGSLEFRFEVGAALSYFFDW